MNKPLSGVLENVCTWFGTHKEEKDNYFHLECL